MSNKILFIFEGEKTENQITKNLTNFFLNENTIIECAYCSTIYQVYKEILNDDDLETFTLLKNRKQNQEILKDYNRDDFAEIYMFFDYDGHDIIADDNKLKDLLEFFNEETEKGKLYINYPMVESLKHISDYEIFKDLKVKCKENINYKKIVSENCLETLKNMTIYKYETWQKLIEAHLNKMNYITNNFYSFPTGLISQLNIFENQLDKYITVDSTIGVLNSFPIFLHDYYGNDKIKELISI
ncbi:hypothetical protein [Flavobacterium chungangensis]|uniref:DUF4276 domain-containing protein n=1 Tax=Flavobacterium chungangensis TaxID=2708132 RepID=A0ABV8ZBG6_9FLAO